MNIAYKTLKNIAQKYTVLYVEDDVIIRNQTIEFLENFFLKVVPAENGEQALDLFTMNSFDIIISDIQMPIMNGIVLSSEVLKIKKSQKIIIISAYNETDYFIDLIKIGIFGFIQKPLNTKQIIEVLSDVCQELDNDIEIDKYLVLNGNFRWDNNLQILYNKEEEVILSENEIFILSLLLQNQSQVFNDIDIFNHINYHDSDKDFSSNAIKSLIKRLRKKLPSELIQNKKNLGYFISLD